MSKIDYEKRFKGAAGIPGSDLAGEPHKTVRGLIDDFESLFHPVAEDLFLRLRHCDDVEAARTEAYAYIHELDGCQLSDPMLSFGMRVRIRNSIRVLREIFSTRSDRLTGFSVIEALWDLSRRRRRNDLKEGFYGELYHLLLGAKGDSEFFSDERTRPQLHLEGRPAGIHRSKQLDALSAHAHEIMASYKDGLQAEVIKQRTRQRRHIIKALGARESDWWDWRWHVRNIVKDADTLQRLVDISYDELACVRRAGAYGVPFGITPFYLSLFSEDGEDDRPLRAQVIPTAAYLDEMASHRGDAEYACDFMGEHDSSPIDLVTRRYPNIAILKPYNTCPQICVYCQRNWEIDDAMAPGAMAPPDKLDAAFEWLRRHEEVKSVLVTGGDPIVMGDRRIREILQRLSDIDHIESIRIGTRMLVTLPMRFTEELCDLFAEFREPGRRMVEVVTHVEHPYEINPHMLNAVERLRQRGIMVYNQLVFTFFTSRRFESARLRWLLKQIGIDPYYTFNTKGKDETLDYRVPIARLLQEQYEEARLLPGLMRTDEAVYNIPRLGKNYLRAGQNHQVLGIQPDGARIYEFHPWERPMIGQTPYQGTDVPVLDYLQRLQDIGEDPSDYASIWYYF